MLVWTILTNAPNPLELTTFTKKMGEWATWICIFMRPFWVVPHIILNDLWTWVFACSLRIPLQQESRLWNPETSRSEYSEQNLNRNWILWPQFFTSQHPQMARAVRRAVRRLSCATCPTLCCFKMFPRGVPEGTGLVMGEFFPNRKGNNWDECWRNQDKYFWLYGL